MKCFWQDRYWCSTNEDFIPELENLFAGCNFSNLILILDRNVDRAFPALRRLMNQHTTIISITGGEKVKSFESLKRIVSLCQNNVNSDSMLAAVGGGALLDSIGFLSGTLFRGLRFISVPTSSMAMIDSAYGGKTAINLFSKNQLGLYHHPERVYVNTHFLKSLPREHFLSGMVEALKLTFFRDEIYQSWQMFMKSYPRWTPLSIAELVERAALLKLKLFDNDPLEAGEASIFLYGHPFANAFEVYCWEEKKEYLPHGFAVGLGMFFSSWLAVKINKHTSVSYKQHLERLTPILDISALTNHVPEDSNRFAEILKRDKYYKSGSVRIPALFGKSGYVAVGIEEITEAYSQWQFELRCMKDNYSKEAVCIREA